MVEAIVVGVVVLLLAAGWQVAEDRGLRIPVLSAVAAASERWVHTFAGLAVPLVTFGLAYLLLEPQGVSVVVPVTLAVGVLVAPRCLRVVRRRYEHRQLPSRPRRVTGLSSDCLDGLHDEAWHLLERRRFGAAAAMYRQAAEIGDVAAMVNLANLLSDELGRPDEAEIWYRRAIDLGSAVAAENLALLLLDDEQVDDARRLLETAREWGGGAGYIGLAHLAQEEGELERARALLEIAIMEGELDAYAPLGEVLSAIDRTEDAERWLRQGALLGADGARTGLARLLRSLGRGDEADALTAGQDEGDGGPWPPR